MTAKEYWSVKRTAIQVLAEADPATFRMLADGYTPRDKEHVFYRADVVAIRDVESYELLENEFSKDKLSAYYRGIEMVGSDAATFTVLDMHYAKDFAHRFITCRGSKSEEPSGTCVWHLSKPWQMVMQAMVPVLFKVQ